MSWVDWVNGYIINHTESSGEVLYGVCRRGTIASFADGAIWGETNFNFLEYEFEMEDDNGKMVKGKVNEFNSLKEAWDNEGRSKSFGGIRMNNEKFVLSKFDSDTETMYLKSPLGGACVAKSGQCFVIGIFYTGTELVTQSGAKRTVANTLTNAAVENCRDKLVEAGF